MSHFAEISHYRMVLDTYCNANGIEVRDLTMTEEGGTSLEHLRDEEGLAALIVQSPNVFGVVERLSEQAEWIHARKGLLITGFTEAMAYGLLASPGSQGADIVCGEGQSFGLSQSFGGPYLGLMATRKSFMRNLPGRLVGQTVDSAGKRAFVLTLSTREQHIRREKAVSNICSNAGLCAMTCAMYLACMGGTGLRHVAQLNRDKAEYLKTGLAALGFRPVYSGQTFNEFVMQAPAGFDAKWKRLLEEKGIMFGMELSKWYPLADSYLFCVTETRSRAEIDAILKEIA